MAPLHLSIILKAINMYEAGIHTFRETESNWIRQNQPEIWKKTHKYLLLSGFFHIGSREDLSNPRGVVGYLPLIIKSMSG